MNRIDDHAFRNRASAPPETHLRGAENSVMDFVEHHPRPHKGASAARVAYAAGALAVLIIAGISLWLEHPSGKDLAEWRNVDFVESRIILPDHVSIWLTPVDRPKLNQERPQ